MTLSEYLPAWLATLRGAIASHTHQTYGQVVRLHLLPALGSHALSGLTRDHVRAFLLAQRHAGRPPEVCQLYLAVLRRALFDAMDRVPPLVAENVATGLWRRVPPELRVRKRPGRFALREDVGVAVLLALARRHPPLYRLVLTYALSAMRRNEGLGLWIDDLDFRGGRIRIARQWHGAGRIGPPKGRGARIIDMAEELRPVLEEAVHESREIARRLGRPAVPPWLFRSHLTGVPWAPQYVNQRLGLVALEAVGRRVGPKAYRHTAATTLMNGGVSPRYVQALMGHADIATTMLYVADETLRDPAALRVLARKTGR